jgi:SAM-dependent methyltransferase
MEMFFEIHRGLPRQAPGSETSTLRALSMLNALPDHPRILDLGCGPGRSAITLARTTGGHVTGVDLVASFLDELRERAREADVVQQIDAVSVDMGDLDFAPASFDLIWSEGAIYNIGFAKGLEAWRPLLTPGGQMSVSELSWLRDDPPDAVRNFWQTHYPPMQSVEENRRTIHAQGYELLGDFALPERDWWDEYYDPREARIASAWDAATGEARTALEEMRHEADILRQSEGSFGYVFYTLLRRR